VTWGFATSGVNVSAAASVSYKLTKPAGGRAEIDQQVGTAHVWKMVVALSAASGSVRLRPVATPGAYRFSLAVYSKARQLLLRTASKTLYVFGQVPLSVFCAHIPQGAGSCADQDSNYEMTSDNGRAQIGSVLLVYSAVSEMDGNSPASPMIDSPKSTCRSVSLNLGVLGYLPEHNGSGDVINGQVVQAAANPISFTLAGDQVTPESFSVGGGPWQLKFSATK
jgi:hypothetical protein